MTTSKHRMDGSPIPAWSCEPDAFTPQPDERSAEQVAEQDAGEHTAEFVAIEQADGCEDAL